MPLVILWRRWPTAFPRRQRQAALAVRLALVAAIVLALAGPELSHNASSQTLVVAADRSASTAQSQYQEAPDVASLQSSLPAQDLLGVVSFGQEALVEDPPEHQLQFQGFATSPGANFTDIESALRLAGSMAQTGTRRHVVLVTDGRQNVGDAVGEARVLHSEGVRVDVLPLRVPVGPDVEGRLRAGPRHRAAGFEGASDGRAREQRSHVGACRMDTRHQPGRTGHGRPGEAQA